jgi:hypothetical protein
LKISNLLDDDAQDATAIDRPKFSPETTKKPNVSLLPQDPSTPSPPLSRNLIIEQASATSSPSPTSRRSATAGTTTGGRKKASSKPTEMARSNRELTCNSTKNQPRRGPLPLQARTKYQHEKSQFRADTNSSSAQSATSTTGTVRPVTEEHANEEAKGYLNKVSKLGEATHANIKDEDEVDSPWHHHRQGEKSL